MELRALTQAEQKYTYAQSQQLRMQTGSIGHLRADFDGGDAFFSTWNDHNESLKTDDFNAALSQVIHRLQDKGELLGSLTDMRAFCRYHPEAELANTYTTEFGFRVEQGGYAFLMRCNPSRYDYNLYCFCYQSKWLDRHIQEASKGIRFITPKYDELFRIADGDRILVLFPDGHQDARSCRYIDEYHTEVGGHLVHIAQFAEQLQATGCICEPENAIANAEKVIDYAR